MGAQHEAARRQISEAVSSRRERRWVDTGELVALRRAGKPGAITTQHTQHEGRFIVERRCGAAAYLSTAREVLLTRGILGELLLP
ncbi:hypothetical protein H4218_001867 [Coemansia sp. IMI 209128]|nr:hypothetical protein H4218_001867 [Coemansia sp. IMI 209128]